MQYNNFNLQNKIISLQSSGFLKAKCAVKSLKQVNVVYEIIRYIKSLMKAYVKLLISCVLITKIIVRVRVIRR